ncbi:MAG: cell division protein [Sphingomonadales bacterium]|jgi:cell division transport system permease protein|nr:cell division protein [Sphingomonadales bacterium]
MFELFRFAARDKGVLPEHRSSGMLPWLIAIMLFLTALACWAGMSLAGAAASLSSDLDRRATVQLAEPNARLREGQIRALLVELDKLSIVESVRRVSDEELSAMLDPWLGDTARNADIPVPALIDLVFTQSNRNGLDQVKALVTTVAPNAQVTADAEWLAPASSLLRTLKWLALGLVALMAVATGSVVVMAVRSSLNTHGETIDIMHLMGASDRQVAQLFERQIARDALLGGTVGVIVAILVILPLSARISSLGGGLPGETPVQWWSFPMLILLPVFGVGLARLVARRTVMSNLGDKL